MKQNSNVSKVEDLLVSGAKSHFKAAAAALRTGCAEALITGLHLIALHARTNSGHGGVRSVHDDGGFTAALEEIGIPKPTAYRWINAAAAGLKRACLIMDGEDLIGELPELGMPRWESWEKGLREVADGMSLNRLLLGTTKVSTDEHRYDELISADEEGRQRASELLQGVADGRYTLVQAVKALGSLETYDRLKAEGGEKIRKDPVYVAIDEEGKVGGLVMKSLVTLMNAATSYQDRWDEVPNKAKVEIRTAWLEVQAKLPEEIKSYKLTK
jgi:hypothetical protein